MTMVVILKECGRRLVPFIKAALLMLKPTNSDTGVRMTVQLLFSFCIYL